MVTSATSSTTTSRTSTAPMRHSDLYSAILELLLSSPPSNVVVLRLRAYTRAEVQTGAEKLLVSSLITQLGRVEVLELGHAVDDDILQEVGRTCRLLRKLKISGPAVTDAGLGLLCTEGSQSGLCLRLASLSVLATTSLSLEAVLVALHHLQHLEHLSLQENLVLQLLRRADTSSILIGQSRLGPFRAWKPTIPYAIKNQRVPSKQNTGLWMSELVLSGIRLLRAPVT